MCRLFLIVFFALVPCTLFAFWPLSWELGKEKRFIGPLVSYDEKDNERHIVFRPLLSSYDSEDGGTVEYLYPLGKTTPEKSYFIPIYMSNTYKDASDTAFLLFFYGTSPEGSYGGFFPLAGKLKKRFAKDEMGFFLWPLYSYTRDEDATKTNIAWPFFSIYSGAEEGFKAWPLYGTKQRPGVRHSQFFLWPLGFKEEKNLDTDNPIDTFYLLPFYLRSTSRLHETKSVFYPFFTYRRNQDKEEWSCPWPVFSKSTGPEVKGFTFFPFYSDERAGRDRKFYFLWPIYSENEWYFKDQRYSRKRVLVINRFIEEENATFFNIWPFFEYREKEEDYLFLFPSVLPFRDRSFDRIVKPLITIYEQRREQGVLTSNFLYGFYTREEQGENWRMRFAFLLELSRQEGEPGFEILSGLFGIDYKRIKVFYIPFDRPADPPAAVPAHAETHSGAPAVDHKESDQTLQPPPTPAADRQ